MVGPEILMFLGSLERWLDCEEVRPIEAVAYRAARPSGMHLALHILLRLSFTLRCLCMILRCISLVMVCNAQAQIRTRSFIQGLRRRATLHKQPPALLVLFHAVPRCKNCLSRRSNSVVQAIAFHERFDTALEHRQQFDEPLDALLKSELAALLDRFEVDRVKNRQNMRTFFVNPLG